MPDSEPLTLIDRINALLPQTQCQRCDYDGCRPYAAAIANGDAINRCPPGGDATIAALARLLHKPIVPLDPEHGEPGPRRVAMIREAECIGCTKCIQACPTDAILGAAKHMHTVIETECTGCELCIAPCPVDCIDLIEPQQGGGEITATQSQHWQHRHEARNARLARQADTRKRARQQRLGGRTDPAAAPSVAAHLKRADQIKAEIKAAVERSRARKAGQLHDRKQDRE